MLVARKLAKIAGESKRGQHRQARDPPRSTSAAQLPSPIRTKSEAARRREIAFCDKSGSSTSARYRPRPFSNDLPAF
jgi:hypothetical protein